MRNARQSFELEDLGAKDLKGIAVPVRAWAALRASSVESRFEALHTSGLTALVGREEELELLLRRWSKAKAGEGQVVLLSGEAGIGKSRLTAALLERLTSEPHTRLRYFCSPQHTDGAFYRSSARWNVPLELRTRRAADKARQARCDVGAELDISPRCGTLCGDAVAAERRTLSPARSRSAPTAAKNPRRLDLQMEVRSRSNPVLTIVEDVHWSDPTSLEAFGRAVDRVASHRVLLIVTFRPEFDAPWIGRPHVTALTLNRLEEREVAILIDRVSGDKRLPANVRQDIIERTDGIPLFVEEITKAVLEAESHGAAENTLAAIPFSAFEVPASLHASLLARLDRLGRRRRWRRSAPRSGGGFPMRCWLR